MDKRQRSRCGWCGKTILTTFYHDLWVHEGSGNNRCDGEVSRNLKIIAKKPDGQKRAVPVDPLGRRRA